MKNKIRKIAEGMLLASVVLLAGCGRKPPEDVVILYTNDVHTYIDNTQTDDDGNVTELLTYSSVAALKNDLAAEGKNVLLVDAGDHVQGTAFGGYDKGMSIVEIMNAAGYDVSAVGNHEFDYGLDEFDAVREAAEYPYISCNFHLIGFEDTYCEPYYIADIGNVKIAFVGISTPDTLTSTTPVDFKNDAGEYIYSFSGENNGQELYDVVQKTIDEVAPKADYIIGLGHLGVDPASIPYTSEEVIANTHGFDAFIDGHSHTEMVSDYVTDNEGNHVLLTQTGSALSSIGEMTVSADGTITTELIYEYENDDENVKEINNAFIEEVNESLGTAIAYMDNTMYLNDEDNRDCRIIRYSETNLGDFVADAYYYYFNEEMHMDCDVCMLNSGGYRAEIEPGEFTYLSSKSVSPFGNVACMVEVSGQDIVDALEYGARYIGVTDPESGLPAETGGFLQVAGLKYTIKADIPSTVSETEEGVWSAGPSGEYKVSDVEIYNRETMCYEPVDPDKTYTVSGITYILRNQGDGFCMLADSNMIVDYVLEDYLIVTEYAEAFEKGDDGLPHINSQNSPLAEYDGYLIDYESCRGAGRITQE